MKPYNPFLINLRHFPADGLQLSGETPLAPLLDLDDDARLEMPYPLQYDLRVSRVSAGILLEGRLETRVRSECDRCLGSFDLPLRVPDVCWYHEDVTADEIDLTPDVREDILLAFPQRLICRDDCRGLCPECGQNLNEGTCSCHRESEDGGPWDALDRLRLDRDLPQ